MRYTAKERSLAARWLRDQSAVDPLIDRPLVQAFIDLYGDPHSAMAVINKATGHNSHKRKLTEWKNGVTAMNREARRVMQGHVLAARFDLKSALALARLLDIPMPGENPKE